MGSAFPASGYNELKTEMEAKETIKEICKNSLGKDMKMQLKRDTDYALRILLYAAKQNTTNGLGMTASEFGKNTSVPVTIAARLCRTLTDAEFLNATDSSEGCVRYALRQSALKKTILNVICAVEDQGDLFAVFDRSTELYAICKDYFNEVDQQFSDSLKSITIAELLGNVKKIDKD